MRQLIGLVVFPHVLQHLMDGILVRHFSMEVDAHQVGHPVQQARDLQKLLSGVLHTVRPGMVNQENALKTGQIR